MYNINNNIMKKMPRTKAMIIILVALAIIMLEVISGVIYLDQDAPFFNDGNVTLLNAHLNGLILTIIYFIIAALASIGVVWFMEKFTE